MKLFIFFLKKGEWALPLLLALSVVACDDSRIPSLASITSVSPRIIEPGDIIEIRGSGFVQGPSHLVLEGELKSEGLEEVHSKSVFLQGSAVSANLVEFRITSKTLKDFISEPTHFKGRLELSFPTYQSAGPVRVLARSEMVELEFRPAGGGIPLAARKTRKANKFLRELGITLVSEESGEGLLVSEVEVQSSADLAGVEFGDRLLALDGTALAKAADLSRAEIKDEYRFEVVSREGEIKEVLILAGVQSNLASDELLAIVLSSIALGLFLAFSAPAARWFARPAAEPINPALKAMGFGLVSVPLVLLPALAILYRAGYGATVFLASMTTLALAMAVLFQGTFSIKRVGRFFAHAIPIPAMIIVAGACGSALGLYDVVASQQAVPWGWHAWSSPFALVAVIGSLVLIWPSVKEGGKKRSHYSSAINWVAAISAASMVTACCLGGWLVPGVPVSSLAGNGWLMAAACMIFFVKTWIVLIVARWFASVGVIERRSENAKSNLIPKIVVTVVAAGLTLGWMWTDIAPPYRVAGQVLAIAACVTFFTVLTTFALKNSRRSFG